LKQFTERGGYALLESSGIGATSEEKQANAWEMHGIITKLEQKTKITRPTLYAIKTWFPTLKTTGASEMLWLDSKCIDLLRDASEKLQTVEKGLKRIGEIAENSFIIDSTKIRMRQQIGGESLEEAFRNELKAIDTGDNPLVRYIEDVVREIGHVQRTIREVQCSAKRL
jgi:hypothetical protein